MTASPFRKAFSSSRETCAVQIMHHFRLPQNAPYQAAPDALVHYRLWHCSYRQSMWLLHTCHSTIVFCPVVMSTLTRRPLPESSVITTCLHSTMPCA